MVLLALPALSLLFLQNRQVQTQLSRYLTERLSEEMQAHITLSSVNYSFIRRMQVRDLYIEDLNGDTLLYAELTKLRIKQFRPDPKGISFRKIVVENAYVNLVIDSSNVVNIEYFTDRLKNPHTPPELKPRVVFEEIKLHDTRFSISRMGSIHGPVPIDFNDFHLRGIEAEVNMLEVFQDTVRMDVDKLSCMEKSGFDIREIRTHLSINKKFLHFDDLIVVTPGSNLDVPILHFNFDHFNNFNRFSYLVDLQFVTKDSRLKLTDLQQFAPIPGNVVKEMIVDGKASGKLSDLKGDDLVLSFADQSSLSFDFMMIGLPDFSNTFLDFNFKELHTSVGSINSLLGNLEDSTLMLKYPWINVGRMDFSGRFTGYPDQFVAAGLLETDLGKVVLDLRFDPDSLLGIGFNGNLRTTDFQLGRFLNREKELEQLDMDVSANGNLYKGKIRAELEGRIDTLSLYSYDYSNITLDGSLTNNTFEGGFSISDPNIKLDFEGRTDFSGEVPVHRFTADVARARPYFLNLPQGDPSYFASFLIKTDLSGASIDDLNGEIVLVNSLFEKTGSQVQLYDVTLSMRNTPEASLIRVRSDVMDFDLMGQYRLSDLPSSFRNMADYYLDIDPKRNPGPDSSYFSYALTIKQANHVLDFFLPNISLGSESHLEGIYEPENKRMRLDGNFPYIGLSQFRWHNVSTEMRADRSRLDAFLRSDSLVMNESYALHRQIIQLSSANDTAFLGFSWQNEGLQTYQGNLKMHGMFTRDSSRNRALLVQLDSCEVVVKDMPWYISRARSWVYMDSLRIQGLEANSLEKMIRAEGLISREGRQNFHLAMKNLDLSTVPGINNDKMAWDGKITGKVDYQQEDNIPILLSNLEVDSMFFNGHFLGANRFNALWNEQRQVVNMRMLSEDRGKKLLECSGSFAPRQKSLDFDINLQQFALSSINPYVEGIAHGLEGYGNVYLTLDGNLNTPELNGTVSFSGAGATIDYLNTHYYFDDEIRIYHNNFYMENFQIRDETGNLARLNGSVSNQYLKNFYVNLNIVANNVQCLNTSSLDNEDFYGTVYGSGNVMINGNPGKIGININARTERNTAFYLPLYAASEVTSHDFITFVSLQDIPENITIENEEESSGSLDLEMELDITQDAVVQLIFDPQVGDIIETSGEGNLRISMNEDNGLRMFGDVELLRGDYLFTLQNVINKKFTMKPGGSISFNGDPSQATLDLEAVYTLRAAPYKLYPDNDEQQLEKLKKRIPVECHLILEGGLGSPTISTGINMPTADAETRSLLLNATSTDEELMRQFLSLLVINNFYSVAGYGIQDMGTTGNIAGVTASELLSNQLSNWLSQISDDFDIGINYRPGTDVTQDEVEVALSTQLLNDRIIISGNVDVGGQGTNPPEGSNNPHVMGDFDVEFRVTHNVSIFAFNRARDELLYETARYKQGVGISYREEFDNLEELLARYKEAIVNRKKKHKKASDEPPEE